MNTKVDAFINRAKMWREETEALRDILIGCGLDEELKWGKPCYGVDGKNIVLIQGFKAYCALLFFKGMLLKDPKEILKRTGANTRVGRQIRFTSVDEIVKNKTVLKSYIKQAVEVEKSGLKIMPAPKKALVFPKEFQNKLNGNSKLKAAFEALTPGRQRGYHLYFSEAKQAQTRESRIEKSIPEILKGRGINDR